MEDYAEPRKNIWSVSQVNQVVRDLIEGDRNLRDLWVEGEVSNWRVYQSGHAYFTLKDEKSEIRAVIWKERLWRQTYHPKNGDKVQVLASVTVWTKAGEYRLDVVTIRQAGLGEWLIRLEELRRRLTAEGIFDRPKRVLPRFPERVVIITSPDGAAIRDIVRIAHSRRPQLELVLIPALVQGELAPGSLVRALRLLKNPQVVKALGSIDAVIIGRGGGSIEELWAFNDEAVVREVAACPFPIISAVGHEPDWTLCDLAADIRAPTPSHAAHMIAPDHNEAKQRLQDSSSRLRQSCVRIMERKKTLLANLLSRPCFSQPFSLLASPRQSLDFSTYRLQSRCQAILGSLRHRWSDLHHRLKAKDPFASVAQLRDSLGNLQFRLQTVMRQQMVFWNDRVSAATEQIRVFARHIIADRHHRLDIATVRLHALSPFAVLERGYSLVRDSRSGRLVTRAKDAQEGQEVDVLLFDGKLISQVKKVVTEDGGNSGAPNL